MSISSTIKQQVITKVQSCASVQEVYGHEEINPEGWPTCIVKSADMEGEFSSTAENKRTYSFYCIILFPIGQDFKLPANTNRLEYAEQVIATVIDEIINAIDTDFELDGSPTLFTEAADVIWGDFTYEGGKAKAAQITLRIVTEKVVVGS